jgi:GT2 family glycosyltransferase
MIENEWRTILAASDRLEAAGVPHDLKLTLVDNSVPSDARVAALAARYPANIELHAGHGNVGFGAGHNIALAGLKGDYHLILNPDVELEPDALIEAVAFMEANPQCGLLVPAVFEKTGTPQYLCKRYPTVLDFFLRGFAPRWVRNCFRERLDRYELRDVIGNDVLWNPDLVSGCFMFFRTPVLKSVGAFDTRFFLYLEDFDLSIRTSKIAPTAYVPQVRIIHHGGYAARKGLKHVRMFAASTVKFFNKYGWKWL